MSRIPQLDGLRAAAILMVFAAHGYQIPLLWTGVDLFFILSGYLITKVLFDLKDRRPEEGYWVPFYRRRALRILPPFLLFFSAAAILFHTSWSHLWYWYAFFGANFAQAFGKSHVEALSPLWSLAVEEQFYLIWPFVVLLCSKKTLKKVALLCLFVCPCLRAAATPFFSTHFPIYCLTVFRADALCLGAFVAVSESLDSEWASLYRRTAMYGSASALVLFAALSTRSSFRTGANSILFNCMGYSLSILILGGVFIYILGRRKGVSRSILAWAPLRYLACISYTFYLWHVAVLVELSRYFHSQSVIAVLSFVTTSLLAAGSWRFIERPLLSVKRSRSPKQFTAAAAAA